jgi:hypothetical protein
VTEESDEPAYATTKNEKTQTHAVHQDPKAKNKKTSDNMATRSTDQYRPAPHPNIPTNDGTHRITIKWTPPEEIKEYEKDKNKLNQAIFTLVKDLFPDETGRLYRWESEDLLLSKTAQSLTATELLDYITPKVTLVTTNRPQMIFGIRFGFTTTPGRWRKTTGMKEIFKRHKLEATISNSKSTSGKTVTAGYILLKAPNTTHTLRYTQYLRSIIPVHTPYFDIRRQKKSPMDQLIPHLTIQCGEKHVTPLSQTLLTVLTGKGNALFIPRYALSTMNDDQIRKHFQFHEKWSRSLKAITLTPMINHLDQARIEYNDDGTTTERSTREWAASLTETDGQTPALCDVVNGTPDQKTYLVSPSHYLHQAQEHWRQYN